MSQIDVAKTKFDEIHAFVKENSSHIETEADARIQIIDRILIEVLAWRREAINVEPHVLETGYIDYLLQSGGRNVFIIEAKRTSHPLVSTKLPGFAFYKVGGAALKASESGVQQAVSYCSKKSVAFAALTNGIEWVGFRAVRTDGVNYLDGSAAVFPSLQVISENFAKFYDLFSQEGVSKRLYNVYLDREEGSALSPVDPLVSVTKPDEIYLIQKSDLARDLEDIFKEFFRKLTGDQDEELLTNCFVETAESREADASLEKITRDLVSHVQALKIDTGAALKTEIEASFASNRGQVIVIVGNEGAGKSTFIQRFFSLILDRSTRQKCLVMSIDVSESSGKIKDIQDWITASLTSAAEMELYSREAPSYDELQGIFFDHYKRWCVGEYKRLHETNIDDFKIKFGEFMYERRLSDPYGYLVSILKRSIRQRLKIPCIIFDNADNFPAEFQDAVFQYAYALHRAVPLSIIVVPITDRTIWRLSRSGALQTYAAKTFYLPIPSTKDVIEKRINFIKRKLELGEDSRSYFSSRGLRISFKNLHAFAACIEEAFLKTDYVSRRVGWLTNHHLRRSLELSQNIITAPILKVDELVAAYFGSRLINISPAKIVKSLLYGEYNRYKQQSHDYILNLFLLEEGCLNSPLLRMRILRLLLDRANASSDAAAAHMPFEEIDVYFESMGVLTKATLAATEELMKHRLAEPYEPISSEITRTTRLAITYSGRMHMEMAQTESVYVEQMALTTPIRSNDVVEKIRILMTRKIQWQDWAVLRDEFIRYCISEDATLVKIPDHPSYQSQSMLTKELSEKWCFQ